MISQFYNLLFWVFDLMKQTFPIFFIEKFVIKKYQHQTMDQRSHARKSALKTTLILISILLFLRQGSCQATQAATWIADADLNSGESKVIQHQYFGIISPDLENDVATTFNVGFSSIPRVTLSLMGYLQNPPCSGCFVGWKNRVTSITAIDFINTHIVYGSDMYYLRFFYLGVASAATEFSLDYQTLEFQATHNLMNVNSPSRSGFQIMDNVGGEDYSSVYGNNQIVMLVYLGGFRTQIGTTGIDVQIEALPISGTQYNFTCSTSGDAQVSEISFFRISFDKTSLEYGSERLFDSWAYSMVDGNEVTPTVSANTATNFKYRNFLMGFKDITISHSDVTSSPVDFVLDFRTSPPIKIIYQFQANVFPTYKYLYGKTFHLRKRVCDSAHPYYLHSDLEQCYDACPDHYVQRQSLKFCDECHATCVTCSEVDVDSCLTCASSRERSSNASNTSSCLCVGGFYQNTTNLVCQSCTIPDCSDCLYNYDLSREECLICDAICVTCEAYDYCLSCNTTIRYLSENAGNSTSTCVCLYGGVSQENGTCIVMSLACGDGVKGDDEDCDDGNSDSGDGCSSSCNVETDHACTFFEINNGTSLCYYSRQIEMVIKSVLKKLTANEVVIVINIMARNCNHNFMNSYFENLNFLSLNDRRRLLLQSREGWINLASAPIRIKQASYQETGDGSATVEMTLEYFQDISTLRNQRFVFLTSQQNRSQQNRYFYHTPQAQVPLEDPYNNIPMIYYEASQYQSSSNLSIALLVLIILAFIFFLLLVAVRKSVIAVETILIFELAYFSIIGQSEVELGLGALAYYGKYSYGLHINILEDDLVSCQGIGQIYQECNTIDNINVFFYLGTLALFIVLAIEIYKNHQQKNIDNQSNYYSSSSSSGNSGRSQQGRESYETPSNDIKRAMNSNAGTFKLHPKLQLLSTICAELCIGVYFLTAIEYFITAIYQDKTNIVPSIAMLAVVGAFFICLWVGWFKFYPITDLSYIDIAPPTLEKISLYKFHYLGFFVFLFLWGLILAVAPGVVAYTLLLLWCGLWTFLTLRKGIYRSKHNRNRAVLNQIIAAMFSLIFIVADYAEVGDGIAIAAVIVSLLAICLLQNIIFALYILYIEFKTKKMVAENAKQLHEYMTKNSASETSEQKRRKEADFKDLVTPKKSEFMESEMRSIIVQEKMTELKKIKKNIMIATPASNLPDDPSLMTGRHSEMNENTLANYDEYDI